MAQLDTKVSASQPAGPSSMSSTTGNSPRDMVETFDEEKHERPATMTDSEDSLSDGETERQRASLSRIGSARSGRSLTTVVSEVRDGIPNQRDLERGDSERGNGADGQDSGPKDPNLVSWDGPGDSQNPKLWHNRRKWAAVICGMSWRFFSATII